MSLTRFELIRKYVHYLIADPDAVEDEWWPVIRGVNHFNESRKRLIPNGPVLVIDESMCGWKPRTSKYGGLPHLSHIKRKPVPIGTELKVIGCASPNVLKGIKIQRGKIPMSTQPYVNRFGASAACTLRLLDLVEDPITTTISDTAQGWLNVQREVVVGDSWFSSMKACFQVALKGKYICKLFFILYYIQ